VVGPLHDPLQARRRLDFEEKFSGKYFAEKKLICRITMSFREGERERERRTNERKFFGHEARGPLGDIAVAIVYEILHKHNINTTKHKHNNIKNKKRTWEMEKTNEIRAAH
jgi:hypothetical protein